MRGSLLLAVFAALVGACAGTAPPSASSGGATVPRCEELPRIAAPADWYRDSPVYVANEMPVEEIQAWAATKPAFEELWIDREHGGWVTVAFSRDADDRQAELEAEFPEVGVVAVEVDRPMAELEALQRRAMDELRGAFELSSAISVFTWTVELGIGVLSEERLEAVASRFAGEPVCVTGVQPSEVTPEGPQAGGGDGWRLLASREGSGEAYRTGIAFDEASYRELWRRAGLPDGAPGVDFATEVVVWFGAVYGSSCPGLRLDDVVVDLERRIVHGEIVLPGPPRGCTADANPHAFVVAVERSRLPAAPFAIQLGAADPPGGVPEERTVVDADLRAPGAVAEPGQVHGDPGLAVPEPGFVESGAVIEPGFEATYRMSVHCGVEWLGVLNGVAWRTEVPPGAVDFLPPEWQPVVVDETILLTVLLAEGPEPTITATANGRAVVYGPSAEPPPGCD
jgi:hypothetical protein